MSTLRRCAVWLVAGLGLLVSPAAVCFAAPFGYGVLSDLVATAWLAPASLSLAALIAFNAARRASAQAATPKSIT